MTEYVADSPVVTEVRCSGCTPDVDFAQLYELRWCDRHTPDRSGAVDHVVDPGYVSSGESGGESNRLWCEFFHRDSPLKGKKEVR